MSNEFAARRPGNEKVLGKSLAVSAAVSLGRHILEALAVAFAVKFG